jgi:hypothetical protein
VYPHVNIITAEPPSVPLPCAVLIVPRDLFATAGNSVTENRNQAMKSFCMTFQFKK